MKSRKSQTVKKLDNPRLEHGHRTASSYLNLRCFHSVLGGETLAPAGRHNHTHPEQCMSLDMGKVKF